MQKITLDEIISIYNKIKRLASRAYTRHDYEQSLRYINAAAEIAYSFNWRYADNELERMLVEISSKIILKKSYNPIESRMVFYDGFALDNRGLTQQYIRALISWDVEMLFIFEGDDISHSKNIVRELSLYPKAEFFSVNSKLSQTEKIQLLYEKIVDFSPEKAFLHIQPSNVIAVTLWGALTQTTRYQVNITDHAFWLGTSCIDYSIEFRDYGCTVSQQKRGLKSEQILVQPYYPITEESTFQGFPKEVTSDSIVIFTGGAFYKMYGDADVFFGIMKNLLDINPKVIILIAGSGLTKPLKNFIKKNNLQERIILIGNRCDINSVFKKCDIYLSTFPISGGLMEMYAAVNSKPILSYTTIDLPCNSIERFLSWGDKTNKVETHTSLESLFQDAKKLIEDPIYRKERGVAAMGHVIIPNEFNAHFRELIKTNTNTIVPTFEDIDYDKFTIRYLDTENNYLLNFNTLIISKFKFLTFVFFPLIGLKSLFSWKVLTKVFNTFK